MVTVSVPAKVLLFGEHMVLLGGDAYGAAAHRYHTIQIEFASSWRLLGLPSQDLSATQKYLEGIWASICKILQKRANPIGLQIVYQSTFPSHYGWGSSSALIVALMVYGLSKDRHTISPQALWDLYQQVKFDCDLPGSGADVFTQIHGGPWVPYTQGGGWAASDGLFESFIDRHPLFFVPLGQKTCSRQAVEESLRSFKLTQGLETYKTGIKRIVRGIQLDLWAEFRYAVQTGVALLMDAMDPSPFYHHKYEDLSRALGGHGVVKPCGALGGDGFLVWLQSKETINEFMNEWVALGCAPVSLRLGGRMSWHMQMDMK